MTYLSSALYIIGPLAVGVMLLLLMSMSKRLGEALELPRYYRLYLVATFFFLLPLPVAWILLLYKAWGLPEPEPKTALAIKIAVAFIPMTIAITFALLATVKYWGWIWGEIRGPHRKDGDRGEGG